MDVEIVDGNVWVKGDEDKKEKLILSLTKFTNGNKILLKDRQEMYRFKSNLRNVVRTITGKPVIVDLIIKEAPSK